jgi:putative transposase
VNDMKATVPEGANQEAFGKPVPHSIPTIIRSFKSAVSLRINTLRGIHGEPVWQRNYYEHIIRNESELLNIRKYILENPWKWEQDKENPQVGARQ